MSTHNVCFFGELRKISILLNWKKKNLIKSYTDGQIDGWNTEWLYCISKAGVTKSFIHAPQNMYTSIVGLI